MQTLSKIYNTLFFTCIILSFNKIIFVIDKLLYQYYELHQKQLPNSCSALWTQFLRFSDPINNGNCTLQSVHVRSEIVKH